MIYLSILIHCKTQCLCALCTPEEGILRACVFPAYGMDCEIFAQNKIMPKTHPAKPVFMRAKNGKGYVTLHPLTRIETYSYIPSGVRPVGVT